ncbi:hypothetical protein AK812_SmicGene48774 [Symbiodinium microadriaticum]|uniref:Uncharacterized protein n=1 Tax=Symbiodinium microadriaticum TaxID=2951 RepID=A0A1Q8ZK58_SYMMI|nr:hypothetical protein AK812_SmicGene48774 [Symbiodinium microadriaticum]
MLCSILEGLYKVEGRSVLQVICSHGRNRSAALVVALSALFECPCWLPSYGDANSEWWCIAKLPTDVLAKLQDYRQEARAGPYRPSPAGVPGPRTPPGPPPAGADRDGGQYRGHGTFDQNDLVGAMPSVGNPLLDAAPDLK